MAEGYHGDYCSDCPTRNELNRRLTAVTKWLEENQPDVFARGIWDAVDGTSVSERSEENSENA